MSWLPVCLLLLWGPTPRSDDVATRTKHVLDRWQEEMEGLRSFECEFRQEKEVSFLRRPLVSTGTIYYRDRRLLWKTVEPAPSYLALDEKSLRIYNPEFNTLEIFSFEPEARSEGMIPGLTADPRQLREHYHGELLDGAEDGEFRLRFTPRHRREQSDVAHIEVTLSADYLLRAWTVSEMDGDLVHLTVTAFRPNVPVPDEKLELSVPDDVEIIRYDVEDQAP